MQKKVFTGAWCAAAEWLSSRFTAINETAQAYAREGAPGCWTPTPNARFKSEPLRKQIRRSTRSLN
jgi:hypothetical protein